MPTQKQKKVIEEIVESGGNIAMGTAMIQAGYSPATAKTPQKLTESKGWLELLEEYIPDDKLNKVLQEGLEANRVISSMNTGKQATGETADFIEVPDHAIRHKFLETGLKLKDKFPSTKTEVTGKIENITITREPKK